MNDPENPENPDCPERHRHPAWFGYEVDAPVEEPLLCPCCEGGQWVISTESGSLYMLDLDQATQTRVPDPDGLPNSPYVDSAGQSRPGAGPSLWAAGLRRDGEPVPLIDFDPVWVGWPLAMWLDIRGDGIRTYRSTTPVVGAQRLRPAPEEQP